LAQAVVGGPWAEKHVPAHLRHMLMCESGCNDGAAFPFLYLALFLTLHRDNHGKAIAEWFYDAWAYQIIFGTLLGAFIGWAARKLMRFSERHKLVDRESFVAQYVSLAIASMGVNVLLGSDDLLAAFACGTAFAWDGWFTRQTEDSNFSSIVDLLFNVATFIYIGALMPFGEFAGGSAEEPNTLSIWRLFVLAICVLLTKRLPIVIMLWRWIPDIKTFREAVFAGHFGPIGVGAIFIATLARTLLPEEVAHPPQTTNDILALTVQPIIFFFVLCSIILHGLTIPFFAFSKRATTMTRTWSRNPSFMTGDNEPSWVNRFRKTKTGESVSPEEGNMTEIERVLNAQLGIIGRGAIGGDAEKELRRSDTSPSGAEDDSNGTGGNDTVPHRVGLYNARTERELQNVYDDYDEDHTVEREDPTDEWGGEDTIEMKRYRQKLQEKKEEEYAQLRQKQQQTDEQRKKESDERQRDGKGGDLGMGGVPEGEERAPMDRDLNRGRIDSDDEDEAARLDKEGQAKWGCAGSDYGSDKEDKEEREHAAMMKKRDKEDCYPKSKTWVEGSKLVIEYQKTKSSDPEVTVIPLMENEKETISSAEDPAHAWVQSHSSRIEEHLGLQGVADWHPTQAANHLMHHRIPHLYNDYLDRRGKRRNSVVESKEERDSRSQLLFDSMTWASERRKDSPDISNTQTQQRNATKPEPKRKVRRPPSPEEEAPISGWLASPGGFKSRPKKTRRSSTTSPGTSPNRGNCPSGSSGPAKQYVCRPSASDTRRVKLRKKLLSGELSLSKGGTQYEDSEADSDVEVLSPTWSPSSRSTGSKFMPRSSSAGGLGEASPGSTDKQMRKTNTSSSFLQIPRSRTIEPTNSDRESGGRRGHSKSNSVQWLDINDSSHDRLSMHSSNNNRSNSPTRERVDPARIGGGITPRTGSRNPSPTRQLERSRKENEDGQDGEDAQGNNNNSNNHRRKNRIASLFSSLTTPSSSSTKGENGNASTPSVRVIRMDDVEDGTSTPQRQTYSSGEGGILAPPSRTGTGNNASSSNSTNDTPPPNSSASQGVTFNL